MQVLLPAWEYSFDDSTKSSRIFILILPIHTDVCKHCILSTYPPSLVEKKSRTYYSGGILEFQDSSRIANSIPKL